MSDERPRVGTGVYIRRGDKVLFGLRKGKHGAGTWCAPGGKLDMNEDPLACVIRETKEESGLDIANVHLAAVTSDIFEEAGTHYITLAYVADWARGEATVTEPEKFEKWEWFAWDDLPSPLFLSARNFVKNGYNPFNF